jgi:hypothetical protein
MATDTKIKLRVIELRAEGKSFAKIAEAVKISKQTAIDIVKENIDEVETLQAVEMEALFDASRVNLRGRVEQLSALQAKLRDEIAQRDLSEVPTDKLITLFIKTTEALKGEVYTPEAKSSFEQKADANERSLTSLGW